MSRYLSTFVCEKCAETFALAGPTPAIEAVTRHVNDESMWAENASKEFSIISPSFVDKINVHKATCDGVIKENRTPSVLS